MYAEAGLGRLAEAVAVSGRNLNSFPDRTSELGPSGNFIQLTDLVSELLIRHPQDIRTHNVLVRGNLERHCPCLRKHLVFVESWQLN